MAQGDVLAFMKNRPGNRLINGNFAIDVRKAGLTAHTTLAAYSLDRFLLIGGTSLQRTAVSGQNFAYVAQNTSTATTNMLQQRIESAMVKDLRGKTVTFHILMKKVSGTVTAPILRVHYANAIDNFAATTLVADYTLESTAVIDATFRRFKKSFTVTSEMADNGFYVQFGDFSSNTNVIQYAQVMINEGGAPAPFEGAGVNHIHEKQLCQRYFETSYYETDALGTNTGTNIGTVATASGTSSTAGIGAVQMMIQFKVTKRAASGFTVYSAAGGAGLFTNVTAGSTLAAAENGNGIHGVRLMNTAAAIDNNVYVCHWAASAEL